MSIPKKRKSYYSAILIFLIHIGIIHAQNSQDELFSASSFLANPENFIPVNGTQIIVSDPVADYPVYILDIEKDEIIHKIRFGRGPGELGRMYKTITFLNDDIISVYDRQNLRLLTYDMNLNFIEELEPDRTFGNSMQAGFLSPDQFFTVPTENSLLELYSFDKPNSEFENEPVFELEHNESPYTEALDNFLLKQDIYFFNDPIQKELYLAFKYSSLLIKIDETGVVFINSEPDNYLFPESEPRMGRIYALPEIDVYPVGALDITGCENYIYLLYSGQKMSTGLISRFRNPDSIVEEISHSDIVHLYSRETGEFIDTLQLPQKANKFKVHGDLIYLYRTLKEDYPVLNAYSKSVLNKSDLD